MTFVLDCSIRVTEQRCLRLKILELCTIEPWSSGRATNTLSHRAISAVPTALFLGGNVSYAFSDVLIALFQRREVRSRQFPLLPATWAKQDGGRYGTQQPLKPDRVPFNPLSFCLPSASVDSKGLRLQPGGPCAEFAPSPLIFQPIYGLQCGPPNTLGAALMKDLGSLRAITSPTSSWKLETSSANINYQLLLLPEHLPFTLPHPSRFSP